MKFTIEFDVTVSRKSVLADAYQLGAEAFAEKVARDFRQMIARLFEMSAADVRVSWTHDDEVDA